MSLYRHALPLCLVLSGCSLLRPCPRPAHAPAEVAARHAFPLTFPTEGRQVLSGTMAAALSLAMEDFLPLGRKPPEGASPREVCVFQRDAYEVMVAPGAEGVVLVSFSLREDACRDVEGPPIEDIPIVYAVDVRRSLILSIQK